MTYQTIVDATMGTVFNQSTTHGSESITHVVAGDLMSDVLTVEEDNLLMVTSLATDQVVRTADFVGARAVLLVNGKKPSDSLVRLAQESDITVMGTHLSMFAACHTIGKLLG